jgi:pseudaminic acid biosynthesis-associated methylase
MRQFMNTPFSTEQEYFWAGEFGNEYIGRNNTLENISWRTARFSKILSHTKGITKALEIGANIGQNLLAIKNLIPSCQFSAIEINPLAVKKLELIPDTKVFKGSVFDFLPSELGEYDLTFTSGVLIHINPEKLPEVYDLLYHCSLAYILVCEYYNPVPVEVTYRGHTQRLFKRDFAGEMLDKYSDLELIDYGFQYHRDNNFPSDDCTWFLLKKKL